MPILRPHAERYEKRYGGNDYRRQRSTDELDSGCLAKVVDEGFAEGQKQKPFDVFPLYALKFPSDCKDWKHDERGNGETYGDENGDCHVLLRKEEFLGKDEADAPKDCGGDEEDVCEGFFQLIFSS